jgi:hypothetical protein
VVDPRFAQLLQLATDGDESAVASLWWEFEFDFHAEVALTAGLCSLTSAQPGGSQC